jgi:hypothetical protein
VQSALMCSLCLQFEGVVAAAALLQKQLQPVVEPHFEQATAAIFSYMACSCFWSDSDSDVEGANDSSHKRWPSRAVQ